MTRLIGYSRTSTVDQIAGLEAQIRDLRAAGCAVIFEEQISSLAQREQLERALAELRPGDTLIVTKIDRLARSMVDLLNIAERVRSSGASLTVLSPRLDMNGNAGPFGELIFSVIGAIAAFEVAMMKERQKEGIIKARAEGKYKGRKPTARAKFSSIRALHKTGMAPAEIAKHVGVGYGSVYRAIAAQ